MSALMFSVSVSTCELSALVCHCYCVYLCVLISELDRSATPHAPHLSAAQTKDFFWHCYDSLLLLHIKTASCSLQKYYISALASSLYVSFVSLVSTWCKQKHTNVFWHFPSHTVKNIFLIKSVSQSESSGRTIFYETKKCPLMQCNYCTVFPISHV